MSNSFSSSRRWTLPFPRSCICRRCQPSSLPIAKPLQMALCPLRQINIAGPRTIRSKDDLLPIRRERWMRVAALVVRKFVGVVPAEHLELLLPVAQMHLGEAAGVGLAVGNHRAP